MKREVAATLLALRRMRARRAGSLLDQLLGEAGLERDEVFITNVVKARPPGNRDPKAAEVAHHLPWLEAQLALIQPRLVVPLGRHALKHFAPDAKISEVHGTALRVRGRALFPLYHPAAALHNQDLRSTVFEDARRLKAALDEVRGGSQTPSSSSEPRSSAASR